MDYINMYVIEKIDMSVKAPCHLCVSNLNFTSKCDLCHGNGFYSEKIPWWKINYTPLKIEKIERHKEDNHLKENLLYYINSNEYYKDSDKLIHFSIKEAQKECNIRNKHIKAFASFLEKYTNN